MLLCGQKQQEVIRSVSDNKILCKNHKCNTSHEQHHIMKCIHVDQTSKTSNDVSSLRIDDIHYCVFSMTALYTIVDDTNASLFTSFKLEKKRKLQTINNFLVQFKKSQICDDCMHS